MLHVEQAEDFNHVDRASGTDQKGYPKNIKYAYNVTIGNNQRTVLNKGKPLIKWEADE